jgi:Pyrimidine dimer DNA glycosylase
MRLWTIHPKHLDAKGLVALWREGMLAQKVLQRRTRGYQHHPQLLRFRSARNPMAAIASYLEAVYEESEWRGYQFDRSKITGLLRGHGPSQTKMTETDIAPAVPEHHPLFRLVEGGVRDWERLAPVPP